MVIIANNIKNGPILFISVHFFNIKIGLSTRVIAKWIIAKWIIAK